MSELRTMLEARRASAWHEAKALLGVAAAEKRDLTGEEEAKYNRITEDLESLRSRIEKVDEDEKNAREAEVQLRKLMGHPGGRAHGSAADRDLDAEFRRIIRNRSNEPIEINIPDGEMRSYFQPGVEKRDLLTTSGSGLVGNFYQRIQRHLVETASILNAGATVLRSDNGEPIKIPKSTAYSTAAIVSEAGTIPESDPTLGSTTLGAYKYGFLVQVSYELAQDSSFDLINFLAEQTGLQIGNAFGAHAVTGTGTGQPWGALTRASLGVTGPTGTSTSLGTQATANQGGDILHNLAASLAEPYTRSRSAAWLMHGSSLNIVRKLKDSQGRYVFDTDIIPGSGSAGTLLGRPVYTDPTMPVMAANAKSILFGDFSRYWVRQVGDLRFERSEHFAFDKDLITFRGLARLDGDLVDLSSLKYFANSAT